MKTVPPFFVNNNGDLSSFESMERLGAFVAPYDLGALELLDSQGCPLVATAEGYKVTVRQDPEAVRDPNRLEQLLRAYFSRLPAKGRSYSDRAASSHSLLELVQLFQDFERQPSKGIWNRTIGRR
ncbi:MAG TPA: hypothetical protein VGP46_07935 [Acidimicrobiales bacterium]|nr:hypothetical protein [Acidimicrobiales bacterium]